MVKNKSFIVENRRKKKLSSIPVVKRNPFEIHVNKLKHDVIGKKVKTDKGLPGLSRSKANEKVFLNTFQVFAFKYCEY